MGAKLFLADGWTDEQTGMTNLKVAFRSFANAPKNNQDVTYKPPVFFSDLGCCVCSPHNGLFEVTFGLASSKL
jgi:hypothetical protein